MDDNEKYLHCRFGRGLFKECIEMRECPKERCERCEEIVTTSGTLTCSLKKITDCPKIKNQKW